MRVTCFHLTYRLISSGIIRILPRSSTPFGNSDVIISKWSTGSEEYSDEMSQVLSLALVREYRPHKVAN